MVVGKSLLEFFEMACLMRWIWIKLKHEYLSVQKHVMAWKWKMIRLVNLHFLFWDEFPNDNILDLFFTCDTLYFCVAQIYTFGNLFMKKLQRKQQKSSKPWIISPDIIFTVQLTWMLIFNRNFLTCS